ncbi:MAG TPA: sulfurtransferase [Candidatus Nanopelagicaceae bacterium]
MIAPVIDLIWWKEHRAEVVLADVRWYLDGRSGREAFESGHIPGAVFVDLERCLSGAASPSAGRHPLPDPALFAAGMSQVGIGDDDTVVAYDDAGGVIAARLVWMLRAIGKNAALLDGGLRIFQQPLESGQNSRPPAKFTPIPWPLNRIATIDEAADQRNVVLDARNRDRYQGEHDLVDPRAGHIPGAYNLPCRENLTSQGTFVALDELRRRFQSAGVTAGEEVISYCGSGVTACHNLLALELAGLGQGRLFPGSWSQYSHAADRAIATGSAPD